MSTSVGYDPVRPWQQKWRDVLDGLAEIEHMYAKDSMSNEPVRRAVEDFFADCRELADWLDENASVTQAKDFVMSDADLQLSNAMAQTTKHHTRRPLGKKDSDPITARISRIDSGGGVRAEINWSSPSGKKGDEDVLDLALRCVVAWRAYFSTQQLDPGY